MALVHAISKLNVNDSTSFSKADIYTEIAKLLSEDVEKNIEVIEQENIDILCTEVLTDLKNDCEELQFVTKVLLFLIQNKHLEKFVSEGKKLEIVKSVIYLISSSQHENVLVNCFSLLIQISPSIKFDNATVEDLLMRIDDILSKKSVPVSAYFITCNYFQRFIKDYEEKLSNFPITIKLVFLPLSHPSSKVREVGEKTLDFFPKQLLYEENELASLSLLKLIKESYSRELLALFKEKQELYVLKVWKHVVNAVGKVLHSNLPAITPFFQIIEKGFKSFSDDVIIASFLAWKCLINNFALSEGVLNDSKKLRFVLKPFKNIARCNENVLSIVCDVWWNLAWNLSDNLSMRFTEVCIPLLELTVGKISTGLPEKSVHKGNQVTLMRKGCFLLLRFLEQPPSASFNRISSPKKLPYILYPALQVPVDLKVIVRHFKEIINAIRNVFEVFGNKEDMRGHVDCILKSVLFVISSIIEDGSKESVEAVTSFINFITDIITAKLCPSLFCLKCVESLSKLPRPILVSHCYNCGSRKSQDILCTNLLKLLLNPYLFPSDNPKRFLPAYNRLIQAGIHESLHPLLVAQKFIHFVKATFSTSNADMETLLEVWSGIASSLLENIEKTQEVNQGDKLEHDFSCMYDVLLCPFESIFSACIQQFRTRPAFKLWSSLYKTFVRCASLVPTALPNEACENFCLKLKNCLKDELLQKPQFFDSVCLLLQVVLECIDFASNETSNTQVIQVTMLCKRKRPLGNLTSFVDLMIVLLKCFHSYLELEDCSSSLSAPGMQRKIQVLKTASPVDLLKTFFGNIKSGSIVPYVLEPLAEPLSKLIFTSGQKKSHSVHIDSKLEMLWNVLTSCIERYYLGPYDTDFLNIMSPLLEASFSHPRRHFREKSRRFWFATFGPNSSVLKFPDSLKTVLKKAKLPLIPDDLISPTEDFSITSHSESITEDSTIPQIVLKSTFIKPGSIKENESVVEKLASAISKKRKSCPQVNIDDLPSEEFVKIDLPPPSSQVSRRRSIRKRKSFVPALYNDLSQDINTCSSSDTLWSSTSEFPESQNSVPEKCNDGSMQITDGDAQDNRDLLMDLPAASEKGLKKQTESKETTIPDIKQNSLCETNNKISNGSLTEDFSAKEKLMVMMNSKNSDGIKNSKSKRTFNIGKGKGKCKLYHSFSFGPSENIIQEQTAASRLNNSCIETIEITDSDEIIPSSQSSSENENIKKFSFVENKPCSYLLDNIKEKCSVEKSNHLKSSGCTEANVSAKENHIVDKRILKDNSVTSPTSLKLVTQVVDIVHENQVENSGIINESIDVDFGFSETEAKSDNTTTKCNDTFINDITCDKTKSLNETNSNKLKLKKSEDEVKVVPTAAHLKESSYEINNLDCEDSILNKSKNVFSADIMEKRDSKKSFVNKGRLVSMTDDEDIAILQPVIESSCSPKKNWCFKLKSYQTRSSNQKVGNRFTTKSKFKDCITKNNSLCGENENFNVLQNQNIVVPIDNIISDACGQTPQCLSTSLKLDSGEESYLKTSSMSLTKNERTTPSENSEIKIPSCNDMHEKNIGDKHNFHYSPKRDSFDCKQGDFIENTSVSDFCYSEKNVEHFVQKENFKLFSDLPNVNSEMNSINNVDKNSAIVESVKHVFDKKDRIFSTSISFDTTDQSKIKFVSVEDNGSEKDVRTDCLSQHVNVHLQNSDLVNQSDILNNKQSTAGNRALSTDTESASKLIEGSNCDNIVISDFIFNKKETDDQSKESKVIVEDINSLDMNSKVSFDSVHCKSSTLLSLDENSNVQQMTPFLVEELDSINTKNFDKQNLCFETDSHSSNDDLSEDIQNTITNIVKHVLTSQENKMDCSDNAKDSPNGRIIEKTMNSPVRDTLNYTDQNETLKNEEINHDEVTYVVKSLDAEDVEKRMEEIIKFDSHADSEESVEIPVKTSKQPKNVERGEAANLSTQDINKNTSYNNLCNCIDVNVNDINLKLCNNDVDTYQPSVSVESDKMPKLSFAEVNNINNQATCSDYEGIAACHVSVPVEENNLKIVDDERKTTSTAEILNHNLAMMFDMKETIQEMSHLQTSSSYELQCNEIECILNDLISQVIELELKNEEAIKISSANLGEDPSVQEFQTSLLQSSNYLSNEFSLSYSGIKLNDTVDLNQSTELKSHKLHNDSEEELQLDQVDDVSSDPKLAKGSRKRKIKNPVRSPFNFRQRSKVDVTAKKVLIKNLKPVVKEQNIPSLHEQRDINFASKSFHSAKNQPNRKESVVDTSEQLSAVSSNSISENVDVINEKINIHVLSNTLVSPKTCKVEINNEELTSLNTRFNANMAPQTRRSQMIAASHKVSNNSESNNSMQSEAAIIYYEETYVNTPSTSILKKRKSSNICPAPKIRKVTFANPLVEERVIEKIYEVNTVKRNLKSSIQNGAKKMKKTSQEKNKVDKVVPELTHGSLESDDLPSSSEYQDSDILDCGDIPVSSALINCEDSICHILEDLTTPTWVRGLESLLISKNIKTIGDICKLNIHELKALPFKSPKVLNLHKALVAHVVHTQEAVLEKFKMIDDGCISNDISTDDYNYPLNNDDSEEQFDFTPDESLHEHTELEILEETVKNLLKKDRIQNLPTHLLAELTRKCVNLLTDRIQNS